jgi:hypothetical protein
MAVNIDSHSNKFVDMMRPAHRVTYHKIPERGHCDLPDDMKELYNKYIIDSFNF